MASAADVQHREMELWAMTFEHVTITEEVQTKDGLVTQERVTLQYTPDPVDDPQGNAAMSVLHPDFLPASELVYTYNEATGMSESAPRVDAAPASDEDEEDLEEDASDEDDQEDPAVEDEDDQQTKAEAEALAKNAPVSNQRPDSRRR